MTNLSRRDRELLLAGLPVSKQVTLPLPGKPLIYYRETGPEDGIPVLMLHGGSSDSGDYRAQLAEHGDRFKMYAWCAPGFGGSSPVEADNPSSDDYVTVLRSFVAELGLASFHLVGSSLGTVFSICFAERYPEMVRSMTLMSPNTGYGRLQGNDRERWLKGWLDHSTILNADPNILARRLTTPDIDDLVLLRVGAMRESITIPGFERVIHMMSNVDTVSKARAIVTPTLLLVGEVDQIAPLAEHGRPISDALPNCELTVLPGLGHILQLEAPELLNRHIGEFILRQEKGR
jgi:pimeloyl-ACP methyl ester carboxylesterase